MSRWMPSARVMLAALVLLVGGVTDAAAQVTAYLLTPPPGGCQSGCTGTIAAVDVDGRQVLWAAPIAAAFGLSYGGVYTTPDGRFVIWQGSDDQNLNNRALALFDVVTRQVTTVPLSKASSSGLPPALIGNPARPELYTTDATGPIAVSPSGTRRFDCATCNQIPLPEVESVSADGRRVAYATANSTKTVFDTASGAVVAELPLQGRTALGRDGQDIYLVASLLTSPNVLQRYRLSDGQLVHEVTMARQANAVSVDPRSGDVFVVGSFPSLAAYSESLALRRESLFAPWYRQYSRGYSWTFDPNSPNVYVTSGYTVEPGTPYNQIVVFDAATFGSVVSLDQRVVAFEEPGVFAPAPRPPAPGPLTETVQGTTVSLLWSPAAGPATTTRYVLEVGSAPGLSDIFTGLDVGLQTSFGASGVPSGTYYVRVRAGNYSGLSAPSNEVVVQVP